MDFATARRQLDYAKSTSFRDAHKSFVGKEIPPTLSDEAIALVFTASAEKYTTNDEITTVLTSVLPGTADNHLKTLRGMKTERGQFFTRFVLFTKTPIDGLLVGFGTDEMYYVVLVWDGAGFDLWKPSRDLYDRPVLVDEETRTVICLSHHGKVDVTLKTFGDGHIALCPECNRLAYFD